MKKSKEHYIKEINRLSEMGKGLELKEELLETNKKRIINNQKHNY